MALERRNAGFDTSGLKIREDNMLDLNGVKAQKLGKKHLRGSNPGYHIIREMS